MIRVFLGCVCLLMLCACQIGKLTRIGFYEEVSCDTYLRYVEDSNIQIIDVRTPGEHEKSHIKGAINISYFGNGSFRKKLRELELNKATTTLIYCETQHRSLFVAKKFYKEGYNHVIDLDKGMMYWRKQGFPTKSLP